ncbi:polysaccharide deacetylase [Gordoniibacillus kamchatkensis]|uniref:Polysaccharide deacetylase n=1 Tax=Gordoniibacillus kamchatkensis TaxID=1590651 RepID=A0ABR5AEB9_9BACL|nr:polysaccharide deacetylase [Paenibacillus sp. VKM B-2647]KIL39033.1 polysaccharide deacetylase [Paenibacillus sp. VKM B-2647]
MAVNSPMNWPNQANCAAMITVNLDAEFFWLSLAPDSINRPKTLSMGQYGMDRGLDRMLDAFDRFGVKATFFVPGRTAEAYPEKVREVARRGHEIAHHGYAHEHFAKLPAEEQREAIERGIRALEDVCGVRPAGFRAPEGELTRETLRLLRDFGFEYSSSMFGDDRPYMTQIDGQLTDLVEIPIHWELNDFPYFAFNYSPAFPSGQGRIANYTQVLNIWKEEFKGYYKFGLHYVMQFDPQTIGTPGRIALLENLLSHMTTMGGVWFCTGSEMAEFWRTKRSGNG